MKKDYKSIVDRLVDRYSGKLNTWECDFVDSVYGLSDYSLLSERQKEKIIEIHIKYVVAR